jgi:hypothetical protein
VRHAPAESRPLIRSGVLALFLLLAVTRAADAQSATPPDEHRAQAAAELAVTRLAGAWVPLASGSLSFRLTRRIEVEALARVALSKPTVAEGGSTVRLHFGYAGARVTFLPAPQRFSGVRLGLLLAGGNADAEDEAVGGLLDSDNGAVLEPALIYSRTLLPEVAAAGTLAWRYARGFSLLGGDLRSRDLRGPSLGVGFAIGPF